MKKVLVLGATGAMGRYLTPELVNMNYAVTGVGLEESASWSVNATYIQGNAFDKIFLEQLWTNISKTIIYEENKNESNTCK